MESIVLIFSIILALTIIGSYAFRVWQMPLLFSTILHSGSLFFIVGYIIAPQGMGLLDHGLEPEVKMFSIPLVWVGLVFGMQFHLKDLRLIAANNYLLSLLQSIIAFILSIILFSIMLYFFHDRYFDSMYQGISYMILLSALISLSSPITIFALIRRYKSHGSNVRLIRYIASTDALIAFICMGIVASILNHGFTLQVIGSMALNIGMGLFLGVLFFLFFRFNITSDERLALILGMVILIAGISSIMKLSPLFIALLIGIFIANSVKTHDRLLKKLVSIEKPVFAFMLLIAGSYWQWSLSSMIVAIAIVCLRIIIKPCACVGAWKIAGFRTPSPILCGFGLVEMGGIGLAIVLEMLYSANISISNELTMHIFQSLVLAIMISNGLAPLGVKYYLKKEQGGSRCEF